MKTGPYLSELLLCWITNDHGATFDLSSVLPYFREHEALARLVVNDSNLDNLQHPEYGQMYFSLFLKYYRETYRKEHFLNLATTKVIPRDKVFGTPPESTESLLSPMVLTPNPSIEITRLGLGLTIEEACEILCVSTPSQYNRMVVGVTVAPVGVEKRMHDMARCYGLGIYNKTKQQE